eukprot:1792327-Amphidinium_carterae.2
MRVMCWQNNRMQRRDLHGIGLQLGQVFTLLTKCQSANATEWPNEDRSGYTGCSKGLDKWCLRRRHVAEDLAALVP